MCPFCPTGALYQPGLGNAWLGGFYLQSRWIWIDGLGFYYENWYYIYYDYACLYLNTDYGWMNTDCTSTLGFICSKNPFSC
ncbi:snaclec alboaggregin-D subunit beta-like [Eleginops maclovinus]